MPIRIKDISTLKDKYTTNGASASAQKAYGDGVAAPRRPQAASALAAATLYEAATQEAIADKRYEKGVAKAGEAKWQENASKKGKARLASGVQGGADDWATNTKPILDAMIIVNLPPRGVKGSNAARVQAVNEAAMAAAKRS